MKIEEDADNIDGLRVKYMKGAQGWDRESHAHFANLPKGEYYVYVELDWDKNTQDTEFCVTCYGASRTFFLRDEKSLFEQNKLLSKAYASKAEQMLEGVTSQDFASKGAPDIRKYKAMCEEGYGFVYIVNKEKDASFKEKVQYNKFDGLTMCKPQQG